MTKLLKRPPRKPRMVRFTDAEWAELQAGAAQLGETRSEAIRAGGLARVRGVASAPAMIPVPSPVWFVDERFKAETWDPKNVTRHDAQITVKQADASDATLQILMKALGTPAHVFACAFCPAEFTTESEAVTHIDAVHGDKP